MTADRIELRGLRLLGYCGALPEEQERRQPLAIDLDVVTDLVVPGRTDDLTDTVDYASICEVVGALVESERFELLERLAERVADAVLADPRVDEVGVTVAKLEPPVPQHLERAAVRITRRRAR